MATAKKLDTFMLKDKFGLSSEALDQEALASAVRRSEVMGWVDVSVRPSAAPATVEGEYKCHSFEIWGIEAGAATVDQASGRDKDFVPVQGAAAREINP